MFRSLQQAKPTRAQQAWQERELGLFFSFNVNTWFGEAGLSRFYDPVETTREDLPDPSLFDPAELDLDQWMHAARTLGAEYAILTAKHVPGFCLWPTETHEYSVAAAPWRDGAGDLVAEFVAACRRHDVAPGLYYNSRDDYLGAEAGGTVRDGAHVTQAEYDEVVETHLRELLGDYGDVAEVWIDGGFDPEGPDIGPIVADHQPDAMVFGTDAATIRWIGNEDGVAPDPHWNAVDPAKVGLRPNAERDDVDPAEYDGEPAGSVWLPGECDTPVREGRWFWAPDTEDRLKSVSDLLDVYYRSIGRGCNLLLNANPDRRGLVPEADLRRYRAFDAERRRRLGTPLAATSGVGSSLTLTLDAPERVDHAVLMEDVRDGQRVASFALEGRTDGAWTELARGHTVGRKRIAHFDPVTVDALRARFPDAHATPAKIRRFAAHGPEDRAR
jgi:alpha-L-fucosidase